MGNDSANRAQPPVAIPPHQPFLKSLKYSLKETFFPDVPLRQFKNKPPSRKVVLGLQYFLPILEWAPNYTVQFLKSDLIAGITIASLAIPQGISYAKLANLPPLLGLYSSFIPPLVYAMMGSSRDLAVGTVAVGSLLMASMLSREVHPIQNPKLYLHLAFTATFFAGILQASLGLFRSYKEDAEEEDAEKEKEMSEKKMFVTEDNVKGPIEKMLKKKMLKKKMPLMEKKTPLMENKMLEVETGRARPSGAAQMITAMTKGVHI